MAKIKDVIARVDEVKPNAFSQAQKLYWLAQLDGRVAADVMLMYISDIQQFNYQHPDDLERELLVSFPHEEIYDYWLQAKIDEANGEDSKYMNTMEAFNAAWNNFVCWFARTYQPARGYPNGGVLWGM